VTDRQRSWLVNKVRTDIAMMGTKLRVNARVIIKNFLNLQNMHEKSLPPTGALAKEDGAGVVSDSESGLGPPARQGTSLGRSHCGSGTRTLP
jgi:hypothetical protein